jgi:heme oxygenase (mycobilin-producing)
VQEPYVAVSEIRVPLEGAAALRAAFADRLRAVDAWEGFVGLELLADRRDPERYVMISRWTSREQFVRYMRSEDHRRSHDRIPDGPHAPRAGGFDEFDVVAR